MTLLSIIIYCGQALELAAITRRSVRWSARDGIIHKLAGKSINSTHVQILRYSRFWKL
jgi:hypothetical protein